MSDTVLLDSLTESITGRKLKKNTVSLISRRNIAAGVLLALYDGLPKKVVISREEFVKLVSFSFSEADRPDMDLELKSLAVRKKIFKHGGDGK